MIAVIADDLSGAAELAGLALRHGLRAEVQTAFSADTDADVVCVDTDTRLLPEADAARVAGAVAQAVVAARPAWIFKKCDSVLRGPVLAEARAVARVTGASRIVILPANPSRGRIIRGGEYFVAGVPLHQTDFARDPAHPRQTARVTELLAGDLAAVETPDAETPDDIARVAATVDATTLPVGAADFFATLLAEKCNATSLRVPPGQSAPETSRATLQPPSASPHSAFRTPQSPALLVCGSAASWPQRRAAAEALGIPVFSLPLDFAIIARVLRASQRALVGIGDGPITRNVSSEELTQDLAASVAVLIGTAPVARLLIEGGATAHAVVRACGWTRLHAYVIAAPGVGALCPVGGGPLLLIKPGSYAWPADVWPTAKL